MLKFKSATVLTSVVTAAAFVSLLSDPTGVSWV